jgi:hypothetical protein
MALEDISTLEELLTAIDQYFRTPRRPAVTGAEAGVIFRKIVQVTKKETRSYLTIADRDADTDLTGVAFAFVADATGDESVQSGSAVYFNHADGWQKISEYESLDVVLDWENITGKPDLTFAGDIQVRTTAGFGKYANNSTIPAAGKTANEVIIDALTQVIHPSYVQPSASLSSSPSTSNIEVGTELDIVLDSSFTQNDAGSTTGVTIRKGSTIIATAEPYTDENVVITKTPQSYYASYAYGLGPIKNNNLGEPDTVGRIGAGSVNTATITYVGLYSIQYGAAAAAPSNGTEARLLPQNRLENAGNVFNLDTGAIYRTFVLVLPPGKSLVSIIDMDALNFNITSEYALVDSTFTGKDAGGSDIAGCKLYVKTQSIAYSANHRHQITIA